MTPPDEARSSGSRKRLPHASHSAAVSPHPTENGLNASRMHAYVNEVALFGKPGRKRVGRTD
eukprot:6827939-Prymnesium_polylepis.1